MNQNQTVIFWKPELLISALPTGGLCVAVKAMAPSAQPTAAASRKPKV